MMARVCSMWMWTPLSEEWPKTSKHPEPWVSLLPSPLNLNLLYATVGTSNLSNLISCGKARPLLLSDFPSSRSPGSLKDNIPALNLSSKPNRRLTLQMELLLLYQASIAICPHLPICLPTCLSFSRPGPRSLQTCGFFQSSAWATLLSSSTILLGPTSFTNTRCRCSRMKRIPFFSKTP